MTKIFRILGPPGTGKTTYLTKEIKTVTEKYGAHNVIVSSFTKAAAAELAGKNMSLKKQIGTLHSHAYRSIGSIYGVAAGECLNDFNKQFPQYSLGGTKGSEDVGSSRPGLTPGDDLQSRMNIYRARLIPVDHWAPSVQAFHKAWTTWKEDNTLVDFSDMIEKALLEVKTAPGNPEVMFVDEAQDNTPLEMALIRKWAEHTEYTVMAGDDDQCLYSFLGATPRTLMDGQFDYTKILDQSWRIPRLVQAKAEDWIKKVRERVEKEYNPRDFEGEVIRSRVTLKNTHLLMRKIQDDLDNNMSVMILTTCSYMLHPILKELRKNGIAFSNKYRTEEGAWNPLKSGGTAGALSDFLLPCRDVHGTNARIWTPKELERTVAMLRSSEVLTRGVKAGYKEMFTDKEWNEDMTVDQMISVFPLETSSFWGIMNNPDKDVMLKWVLDNMLGSKINGARFPMKILEKYGTIPRDPQVTVGTIHSVKGGQSDSIYLFPDLSTRGALSYSKRGEEKDSVIRAFYVGMTRAKKKLTLCQGQGYAVRW